MTSKVTYNGNLRTTAKHIFSGLEIITDAPLDNQGLAKAFSPTDLVATALASCLITIMGISIRNNNYLVSTIEADIEKVMTSNPRRISQINIIVQIKSDCTESERETLERIARACPVAHSLHSDIVQNIEFVWH